MQHKDMRQLTQLGRAIESSSFQIIDQEVGPNTWDAKEWQIVRRVIHSTADFEYCDLVSISQGAIEAGIRALESGCPIVTDVDMIRIGLSPSRLEQYQCEAHCFISDPDVIASAKEHNSTRARYSMKKAADLKLLDGAVVAIGNAPTALLEIIELAEQGIIKPALLIGVPVGFVSAAESKELTMASSLPHIVTKGRKGGSTIAVSIVHALFYLAAGQT